MSYKLLDPRLFSEANAFPAPAPYPIYPLGQAEPAPLAPTSTAIDIKKVIIALVLIGIIYMLLKRLAEGSKAALPAKNPVQRATTAQLAKNLYERLDARGTANPTVMRSLARYAKPKTRV